MKRILSTLTLLLCFAFTAVNAQVITVERAAEIANSFFSAGVQKSGAARGVVASSGLTASFDSNDVTETASANPTFYVLTNPEGGFVIVSGEETENPIIGYSFDGTIDTSNLPGGFVDYMTDIDAQVKALREYNANNPQKAAARSAMQRTNYNATSMGNIVKDLKVANFHQEAPFNNLCFTKEGRQAVAGCVPTAYAMLCNYYNWPIAATGEGVHAGTGETMQFGHEYDWNNILDDYSGTYTNEQATAVATLVRDLGWAYQVGYGVSDTGSGKTEGASVLIEQFGFKSLSTTHSSATYATDRDVYNNNEGWKAIIKDCLNNNYPIPYSAYNTSTKGRHIFMLDGYTDNDYYHFNWGWGDGNGWFTLDNMVPSANRTYTSVHRAYFYLIPNTSTYRVTATAIPSNMGTVSINGGTAGSEATADLFSGATATLTAHPAQGYALVNWTKGGEIVGTRNTLEVTVGTDANEYVANFDNEANVYVIKDYIISPSTVGLTGSSKESVVNYQTSNEYPAALSLASTATNGASLYAMSRISNDQIRLYAYDQTTSSTTIKYTLSVPDGYQITEYKFEYSLNNINYPCSISYSGGTISSPTDDEWHSSPVIVNNAQTAEFTISAEKAHSSSNFYIKNFIVTVAKISAEGGGSTPTTYTINVNAETGGNAYVNGTNTSATVDAGTDVTLQAYPDGTNYTFAGWYNGNSLVSSNNPYTFALNSDVTYTAKFNAVATTYNITAEASPQNAGMVAINGGTQSTVANIDATSGSTVSLQAYPNSGYEFTGWYNGATKVSSDNPYSITATAAISYIASFQEVQQGGSSSTNLAGKYFRLKEKTTGKYMNIENNTEHPDGTIGGVNVTAKNESYDGQIFQFIESGTGYKLLSKTGYYIKCQPWNVDAISEGTVLSFETAGADNEYFIKWDNTNMNDGVERDDYFKAENGYVYCDAAQGAAAVWVLEEVVYYTVTATAGNGGSVSPETSTVKQGNTVTLVATPNVGYHFVNWTKGETVVSTNATYAFTPAETATYTANFEINTYTVSVSANGTGGNATASATTVEHGASVTLTAQANEGYHFVNWTLNGNEVSTNASYTFNATAAGEYVANFEINTYSVSVSANGTGGNAMIGTESSATVEHGASVTLTAEANEGYHFVNWTLKGNVVSTNASYTFNAADNGEYVANFEINTYSVSVSANGTGGNAMIGTETSATVEHGASVTLTAEANEGYHFVNWTLKGNVVSTDASYTFNATAAGEYVANFEINTYSVSVSAGEGGSASTSDATVEHGASVTLTATPSAGYSFAGWYDEETLKSAEATYTFTVTSDINYTARFNEEAGETPTTYTIRIETEGLSNDKFAAFIYTGITQDETQKSYELGSPVKLIAVQDNNDVGSSGYAFVGWFLGETLVSENDEFDFNVTGDVTYKAKFVEGIRVSVRAERGWPSIYLLNSDKEVGGTSMSTLLVPGRQLKLSVNPEFGCRFVRWTVGEEVVSTDNPYITEPLNEAVTFKAICEPASYNLTVRANNDGWGTVSATSVAGGSETEIIVGHNMEATITATANTGYRFVNWTKGTDVVSTEATYTIAGIENVEDMLDAEYVAVFEEIGTYCRIAYNFEVPVAAKSAATRAAGDTYSINNNTGVLNNAKSSKYTEWIDNTIDATELSLRATNSDGTPVHAIKKAAGDYYYQFHAYTCDNSNTYSTSTKYTLSVSGNYIIKECSITYKQSIAGQVTISYGDKSDAFNNTSDNTLSLSPNAQTVEFTLTSSARSASYYLHIKNFTVTIQSVGGETPEPETETVKYYVQSEAVSGTNNAMIMRSEDDENYNVASSIFYCVGNKLMSYATGTYVNENDDTRGLQAVGVAGGDVTITTSGETATIAAPSYLHAVINQNGTSYVDHCGSDNGEAEHNFIIEEVTSLPVTISAAGYATWYAPVAVQLPDGLTAYTITIQGKYAVTGDEGFTKIPANTGVILAGAEGPYELEIIGSAPEVESIMRGTVAATYFPENDYAYVLSNKGSIGLGFYMAQDGAASWSHKAYLPKSALDPTAQMSAGFRLILPGTTAVEDVEIENEREEIYDLTGRKLEGISGTGIYIINGKKVLVK